MGAKRKPEQQAASLTGPERRYEAHNRRRVAALRLHVEKHGWLGLRAGRRAKVGAPELALTRWLVECRHRHKRSDLPPWLATELESIPGWDWDGRDAAHERFVALLHGLAAAAPAVPSVADELVTIALLLDDAKQKHRKGRLARELEAMLVSIPGWSWE